MTDAVYPTGNAGNGKLNEAQLQELGKYGLQFPQNLPKIANYIGRRAREDFKKQDYERVKLSLMALQGLIEFARRDSDSADAINLFSVHILDLVAFLLEQRENTSLCIEAAGTFVAVSQRHIDEYHQLRNWDTFVEFFTGMIYQASPEGRLVNNLSASRQPPTVEEAARMHKAALQALSAIISTANVVEAHLATKLEMIVPALLFSMSQEPRSAAAGAAGVGAGPSAPPDSPAQIARECLRELADSANSPMVRSMMDPIFGYLRDHRCWSRNQAFCEDVMILMVGSVKRDFGLIPIVETLANLKSTPAVEDKIAMMNVVGSMIRATSDAEIAPPLMLEVLHGLLTELLSVTPSKRDEAGALAKYREELIATLGLLGRNLKNPTAKIDAMLQTASKMMRSSDAPLLRAVLALAQHIDDIPEARVHGLRAFIKWLTDITRSDDASPEARVVVQRIFQDLVRARRNRADASSSASREHDARRRSNDAFYKEFGPTIRSCLYVAATRKSGNTPENIQAISQTFEALLDEFRQKEFENSLSLIFKIQDKAADLPPGPSQNAHMLVASYLLRVAHVYKSDALESYVTRVLEKRGKAGQLSAHLTATAAEGLRLNTMDDESDSRRRRKRTRDGEEVTFLFAKDRVAEILARVELLHGVDVQRTIEQRPVIIKDDAAAETRQGKNLIGFITGPVDAADDEMRVATFKELFDSARASTARASDAAPADVLGRDFDAVCGGCTSKSDDRLRLLRSLGRHLPPSEECEALLANKTAPLPGPGLAAQGTFGLKYPHLATFSLWGQRHGRYAPVGQVAQPSKAHAPSRPVSDHALSQFSKLVLTRQRL